jgi:hypothetical protein
MLSGASCSWDRTEHGKTLKLIVFGTHGHNGWNTCSAPAATNPKDRNQMLALTYILPDHPSQVHETILSGSVHPNGPGMIENPPWVMQCDQAADDSSSSAR